MKILALEFSSERRSVAVSDSATGDLSSLGALADVRRRETRAFQLIEDVLDNASAHRGDIDCIAVGLGPGSYAGVRTAIAIAQGWQLALGVKLTGIGSMDAMAARLATDGERGTFGLVVDAQRGEFYLGLYELDGTRCEPQGPMRIVSGEQIRALQGEGLVVAGPPTDHLALTPRGAYPEAASVAALAGRARSFVAGESLEPIYLRPTNFVKAPPPRFRP